MEDRSQRSEVRSQKTAVRSQARRERGPDPRSSPRRSSSCSWTLTTRKWPATRSLPARSSKPTAISQSRRVSAITPICGFSTAALGTKRGAFAAGTPGGAGGNGSRLRPAGALGPPAHAGTRIGLPQVVQKCCRRRPGDAPTLRANPHEHVRPAEDRHVGRRLAGDGVVEGLDCGRAFAMGASDCRAPALPGPA